MTPAARDFPDARSRFLGYDARDSRRRVSEQLNKGLRDAAVGIEARVEDRDLKTDGPVASNYQAEHGGQFLSAQAAGKTIVNRRHDRIIQDVDIEVNEETVRSVAHPEVGES